MTRCLAFCFLVLAALGGTAAAVPGTTSFTARISDTAGTPVDGAVDVTFRIFDQPTGGTMLWAESQADLTADDGLVYARLGAVTALDDTVFSGGVRYLELVVDGDVLNPRLPLDSVPYAMAAGVADRALTSETLGDLTEAEVQRRVGSTCAAGSSIRAIAADGTVTCEADDTGAGTITGVTAGSGLSGGGTTGGVSLSVNTAVIQARVGGTCAAGSAIRAIAADGTVTCETDDSNAGTITGVTAGTGLSGGGTTGAVSLTVNTAVIQARVGGTCAAGSAIRAIAADGTVTCEVDDAGAGTITGVTAGSGLTGGGTSGAVTVAIGANGVTMAHTSAPIGRGVVAGAASPQPNILNTIYATDFFSPDASGSCFVTSRVSGLGRTDASYLRLLVAVSVDGASQVTAFPEPDSDPLVSVSARPPLAGNAYQYQVSATEVVQVVAGRRYQFGCFFAPAPNTGEFFLGNRATCATSYVCQ